jgi:hypothetical protein
MFCGRLGCDAVAESESIGDAFTELGIRTAAFYNGLRRAKIDFSAFSKDILGATVALAIKMASPVALITGAFKILGSQLREFVGSEDAMMGLAIASRQAGLNVREAVPEFSAFATEMALQSRYTDEAIKSTIAYGLRLGVTEAKIRDVTKAAIGLAYMTGEDLNSVMLQLIRVMDGMPVRFGVLRTQVDNTLPPIEQFNQLVSLGNRNWAAQQAALDTTSGAFLQFKKNVGEANEEMGRVWGVAVKPLLDFINKLYELDRNMPRILKPWRFLLPDEGKRLEDATKDVDELGNQADETADAAKGMGLAFGTFADSYRRIQQSIFELNKRKKEEAKGTPAQTPAEGGLAPPSPTVSFATPLTPVEAATPFTPTSEVVSLLQRETPPNPASWSVPGRDLDTNNTVTQANTLATQELTIALRNWQPVLVK